MASIRIQQLILSLNPLYFILAIILPFGWWVYSTKQDYWNFINRKMATLNLALVNAIMVVCQVPWTFLFNTIILKYIVKIPVGRNLDSFMLYMLCRMILIGIVGLIGFLIYKGINSMLMREEIREQIEEFKYQHIVDERKNKPYLYDSRILKDLNTGKDVIIKEVDRFVHMFILGASGTGKTSSTILPMIICDLNKKLKNARIRTQKIVSLIKQQHAYVDRPKYGNEITEWCVKAKDGYEDELEAIRNKYPDCGITALAPNNATNKSIVKLAAARGQMVNSIDPSFKFTEPNVKNLGLNPFFVPLDLEPSVRQIQIANKATTFSEVLTAVSEVSGTQDPYFREVNKAVTINISIMCMLRANLHRTQTNIVEIQDCINDFGKMKKIVEDIQDALHMKVKVHIIEKKNNGSRVATADSLMQDQDDNTGDEVIFTDVPYSEMPEKYKQMKMPIEEYTEMLHNEAKGYLQPIHYVLSKMTGDSGVELQERANGLINIINDLLIDPRIKNILSADENNFIDWDKALANNEITVINTALEFGREGSTALGLFIMLSMQLAVLRRPDTNRSAHFLYIDEASQYMHPMYENMIALYRQYRVAVVLAIQSLSQTAKTPMTKYLAGVIQGAGIHIVFGRTTPEESKLYEEMGGVKKEEVTQMSTNSNSELDPNYNVTSGKRTSVESKSVTESHKIRQRGFQEVTVYMTDAGDTKRGFYAKVSFPKKSDYEKRTPVEVDFSEYALFKTESENTLPSVVTDEKTITSLKKFKTGIENTNIKDENDSIETIPDFVSTANKNMQLSAKNDKQIPQKAPGNKPHGSEREAQEDTDIRDDIAPSRNKADKMPAIDKINPSKRKQKSKNNSKTEDANFNFDTIINPEKEIVEESEEDLLAELAKFDEIGSNRR